MKKIFTLISAITFGAASFSQVIFQSDLGSWTAGAPDGWMGTKTNIGAGNVVMQTLSSTYGAADASLMNTDPSATNHKRFTTQNIAVTAGETYEVEIWLVSAMGYLRTGFYDATNDAYNTYNPYINVGSVSGGNPTMISQNITIPAGCTSGQLILSVYGTDPSTEPFDIGIIIDSVSVSGTIVAPPTTISIYDIQYTTDISGDSPENGNIVTTSGIVTGVIGFGADSGRFFIQDGNGPWNGIYVYNNTYAVALGDEVEVTGTVSEYFGLTELGFVSDVTIVSSSNPQPTPAVINTFDATEEQYESVLVQVTDAKCNNDDAGFGQFIVNDGSGDRLIDDQIYQYSPTLNDVYAITGVTFLSFGEVKIYPRIAADIDVLGFAGLEENNTFAMYPNPANDIVTLNVSSNTMVQIYSMTGALVYEGQGKTIDVSAFEAGAYMVTAIQNETVSTQKLMVK